MKHIENHSKAIRAPNKKGVTLSDYTFFDCDLSDTLLHLLKVRISDSIVTAIVL